MYLDVNFKDGTVTHIALSNSHTIRVINSADQVQDAFSLDGVASIGLNLEGAPEATNPVPDPHIGAAEGATEPAPTAVAHDDHTLQVQAATEGGGSTEPDPTLADGSETPSGELGAPAAEAPPA